jgi:hypothetical protein
VVVVVWMGSVVGVEVVGGISARGGGTIGSSPRARARNDAISPLVVVSSGQKLRGSVEQPNEMPSSQTRSTCGA